MAEWPFVDHDWLSEFVGSQPYNSCGYGDNAYYQEKVPPSPATVDKSYKPQAQPYGPAAAPSPEQPVLPSPPDLSPVPQAPHYDYPPDPEPKGDNPRQLRNKAEKQRRDILNHSIEKLSSMVPPVVNVNKKFDKTSILRYTAHYLRAHQYVFGDAINNTCKQQEPELKASGAQALLGFLNGFLLTTTYRGLVVVVSQNIHQHLGYNEVDLLGHPIFKIIHPDDVQTMKDQLMPPSHFLGPHGELIAPNEPLERQKVFDALQNEKRKFSVRFKKFGHKSDPPQYVTCSIEGSMRKSDAACRGYNRCCKMVRRARARGDNPYSSGNDIVFIGVVRPMCETFISERQIESFKMEYRTRHSVDGEIIQCEQRIALVTGYMTHEVNGVNAMNFMHRDDVRWVIIALRQMYVENLLIGESCYRLMAKNGKFIYMRTRGALDVEDESRAVRTFVCTNTVVEEREGKHLIKMMKKKYRCMINGPEAAIDDDDQKDDEEEDRDSSTVPVENPRCLEKVILHLLTNLPSPQLEPIGLESPERGSSPSLPFAIIPPKRERILGAIEKIYTVIKALHNNMANEKKPFDNEEKTNSQPTELTNEQKLEKEMENIDFVSLLAEAPSQDLSMLLTPEQLKILNNNYLLFNESFPEKGPTPFKDLKMFSTCQGENHFDFEDRSGFMLSPRPPEPDYSLESVANYAPHPILKPQPTYATDQMWQGQHMFAMDQPGPSGVARKRTNDHLEIHTAAKRKPKSYNSVTSTVTSLDEDLTDMTDINTQYMNTHVMGNQTMNICQSTNNQVVSTQDMSTHNTPLERGVMNDFHEIDNEEDEGFEGLPETNLPMAINEIADLELFNDGDGFLNLDCDDFDIEPK